LTQWHDLPGIAVVQLVCYPHPLPLLGHIWVDYVMCRVGH